MKKVEISGYKTISSANDTRAGENMFKKTFNCADCGKFEKCKDSKFCESVRYVLENCKYIRNTSVIYDRTKDCNLVNVVLDNKKGVMFNFKRLVVNVFRNCNEK